MKGKHALVVYCHPEPKSFTSGLKDTVISNLKSQGWTVTLTDLYAENFNPVLSQNDLPLAGGEPVNIISEHFKNSVQNTHPPDVKREVDKILAADLVVTVCPIWWGTVPAMLKGYFDRVLVAGICWGFENHAPVGLLKGKKAFNIYSVGASEDYYAKGKAQDQDFKDRIQHVSQSVMAYCGFTVLQYKAYFGIVEADEAQRKKSITDLAEYVKNIDKAPELK